MSSVRAAATASGAIPAKVVRVQTVAQPVEIVQADGRVGGRLRRERTRVEAVLEAEEVEQSVVLGVVGGEPLVRHPFGRGPQPAGFEPAAVRLAQEHELLREESGRARATHQAHQRVGAAGRRPVRVDAAALSGQEGAGELPRVAGDERDDRQPRPGAGAADRVAPQELPGPQPQAARQAQHVVGGQDLAEVAAARVEARHPGAAVECEAPVGGNRGHAGIEFVHRLT